MPLYEYACDPCRVLYQTRHGMNDRGPETCARCAGALRRVFSPPHLNLDNFSSPTAAKYARMSDGRRWRGKRRSRRTTRRSGSRPPSSTTPGSRTEPASPRPPVQGTVHAPKSTNTPSRFASVVEIFPVAASSTIVQAYPSSVP
jgi:putative FmdB family regulatory protein